MGIRAVLSDIALYEPAVAAWAASGGLAAVAVFAFHATPVQTAAVVTVASALATVYTAWRAVPPAVPLIAGAVATIATASAAFGLHLTSQEIEAGTTVLSGLLALMLRANISPGAPPKTAPVKFG